MKGVIAMSVEIIGGSFEEKPLNAVAIPEPSLKDIVWATKLKKLSSEGLNGELCGSAFRGNLWQVNHILTHTHKNWAMRKQKVDIHYEGDWALSKASEAGHLDVMQLLINNGCDPCKESHLGRAAVGNQVKAVQLLIDHGAHKNIRDSIKSCIKSEKLEMLKFLFSKKVYEKQVMHEFFNAAIYSSSPEVVKYLYENFDIDINNNEGDPIKNAFYRDSSDNAEYLVEKGVKLFDDASDRMRTAIYNNHVWRVRVLLKMGLKADQPILDYALECKRHEIIDILKKEIQSSKSEKAAEKYPKWEKIDNESIAYVSLAGTDTQSCIRTVFNFKACRVLEFSENAETKILSAPLATNFSDFEGTSMLNEAEEVLKEKGGDPTPYLGAKQIDKKKVYKHKALDKRQAL